MQEPTDDQFENDPVPSDEDVDTSPGADKDPDETEE